MAAIKTKPSPLEIRVKRNAYESGAGYTHARMTTDEGGFLCWTLEDEDRGLYQDMPLPQLLAKKVKGATAIPRGRYRIQLRVSPKFKERYWAKPYGGRVPYLCDVPGYEGVCIHPGSTTEDTAGCLLPGMLHSGIRGRVFDSVLAFQDLMDWYIIPAYNRKQEIWITIE